MAQESDSKALEAEERKYIKFLFDSCLESEKSATGLSKAGFEELLVSFGLSEDLSDDDFKALVKNEFSNADRSRTKQLEFDDFVSAYDRLVDLQKEKVKKHYAEEAQEKADKQSSSVVELVPQHATDVTVINPNWVHKSNYTMTLRDNALTWRLDHFSCKDPSGQLVIRCERKTLALGANIHAFDASTGDLLFHFLELTLRATKMFQVKNQSGKVIATLRKKIFSMGPHLSVYQGAAEFDWRGNSTSRLLYRTEGKLFEWQFKVRNEKGEYVAYVDVKEPSHVLTKNNTYRMHVAPGVDASLMVAVALACDLAMTEV